MDMWKATDSQIKEAASRHYGKTPTRVTRPSGLWAYVNFADGTNETVYGWMIK